MLYLNDNTALFTMLFQSENEVRLLHEEFRGLKKYPDRLCMFDRLFGIIPFSFPDFDPNLSFFFQKEKLDELISIFKKERNNPGLTERKFIFGKSFIFNIKPANSNSSVFSNYILKSFLSRQPAFDQWIEIHGSAEKPIESLLDEANGLINHLEYCLQNEYDKSFRLQCMSVFFKGFHDAYTGHVNLPGKKRKFTELYLYTQGIIYANYIGSLKTFLKRYLNPIDLPEHSQLDLPGKLSLLKDLGIIDFLKSNRAQRNLSEVNDELSKLICLITGEYIEEKELVHSFLMNEPDAASVMHTGQRKTKQ
jgi:hypothetical protein